MKNLILFLLLPLGVFSQSLVLQPDVSPPAVVRNSIASFTNSNLLGTNVLKSDLLNQAILKTTTNSSIAFSTNNGSPQLFYSPAGYLGIGTETPTERLDIRSGRIRFTGEVSAGMPSGVWFTDDNAPNYTPRFRLEMSDDNHLSVFTDGIYGFMMNVNNGRLGLGTTPTSNALTLQGRLHLPSWESNDNSENLLLATTNGEIVKAEMNRVEAHAISIYDFGTNGKANFVISSGLGNYSATTSNSAILHAPIQLPNGVRVTNIRASVVDNSTTNYLNVSLQAIANSASVSDIVSCSSKSNGNSASRVEISANASPTTIDKLSNHYVLQISSKRTSDDAATTWDAANLRIGTITVTYEY
ncbi:MAG: hypothetical protein MUF45_02215 [Spirosomaceae bacterium]|jgi:hypothetical protein|nr:hypothetical protein [Spirosomataceae bacterium]